jgi:quercetin dioxygenase-like cupin family protein
VCLAEPVWGERIECFRSCPRLSVARRRETMTRLREGIPPFLSLPWGGQVLASIIAFDDLEHTQHSHEFVGAEHGDVPFSIILVHSQPGAGPKLHRHPYAEVFVVESGQATFQIGQRTVVVDAGHVVVSPPGEAHSFVNTGTGELRLTAIHGADRFDTEWLSGPDPVWSSTPPT